MPESNAEKPNSPTAKEDNIIDKGSTNILYLRRNEIEIGSENITNKKKIYII